MYKKKDSRYEAQVPKAKGYDAQIWGTKECDKICDRILTNLRQGAWIENACEAAGIPRKTFYAWAKKAREGSPSHTAFMEEVDLARAEAEKNDLFILRKLAEDKGDWRGYAWVMERRNAHMYGPKTTYLIQKQVEEETEKILETAQKVLSPIEFKKLLRAMDNENEEVNTNKVDRDFSNTADGEEQNIVVLEPEGAESDDIVH